MIGKPSLHLPLVIFRRLKQPGNPRLNPDHAGEIISSVLNLTGMSYNSPGGAGKCWDYVASPPATVTWTQISIRKVDDEIMMWKCTSFAVIFKPTQAEHRPLHPASMRCWIIPIDYEKTILDCVILTGVLRTKSLHVSLFYRSETE